MAKYLVTGGCGFIGSHLVVRLSDLGHEVTVIDNLSTGTLDSIPDHVELVIGDVAETGLVARVMGDHNGCFHLAAVASTEKSCEQWLETNRTNLVGTLAVFEAACRANGTQPVPVIYASSAAVYGNSSEIPLTEATTPCPLSAYGADKLACELHARVANCVHNVPTIGFRFFNVYGPRQNPKSPYSGVISTFTDQILRNQPILITGNGKQVRDFVYVDDVVRILVTAMTVALPGALVFNICTGTGTSINQLATTLGALTRRCPDVRYVPLRRGDIACSIGSPAALTRTFALSCETSLVAGLEATLAWSQSQSDYSDQPDHISMAL